jgi:single-stranded-DNA-specific exonuclease
MTNLVTTSIPEIVRQILAKRGLVSTAEVETFLHPDYLTGLHDPYLMTDMQLAVDRILAAVAADESIIIYGDYDIDGLTASAVLLEMIRLLGGRAESYIPDRFEEGYGINLEALQTLKARGASLVVSVDCGVTSVSEVAWAMANGLDIVITDHHMVPAEIPAAVAVLNPRRPGDEYPYKDLAGVGVAFKLAQALQQASGKPATGQEKWLLDLVALGTVCDVVPLTGENRVLVSYGLRVLNQTKRPGLRALAEVGRVDPTQLRSHHLGFVLGPRLNAAGRLEHAAQSLELIQTDDAMVALELATALDELNTQRRADQAKIIAEALTEAEKYPDDAVLVLASPEWSHGVVGIAASQVVERLHKPAIILQIMGETTKGSARSLGSFNMVEALRAIDKHFLRFGGHHYAAGMTLNTTELEAFRRDINDYARNQFAGDADALYEAPEADAQVQLLAELDDHLYQVLERLEPFGNSNQQPRLTMTDLKLIQHRAVGADKSHLKATFADRNGQVIEAIGFGLVRKHPNLAVGQVVTAEFELTMNEFNGRRNLELLLRRLI